MTTRPAMRPLTGAPVGCDWSEVLLGFQRDGTPRVSLQFWRHQGVTFADPEVVEALARDLLEAAQHLRNGTADQADVEELEGADL